MGGAWEFNCPRCGYSTTVSGQPDSGFDGRFQTMTCNRCKEVHNILVKADDNVSPERKKRVGRCPTCNGKKHLAVWDSQEMPCPKCGARMIKDPDKFILWD